MQSSTRSSTPIKRSKRSSQSETPRRSLSSNGSWCCASACRLRGVGALLTFGFFVRGQTAEATSLRETKKSIAEKNEQWQEKVASLEESAERRVSAAREEHLEHLRNFQHRVYQLEVEKTELSEGKAGDAQTAFSFLTLALFTHLTLKHPRPLSS